MLAINSLLIDNNAYCLLILEQIVVEKDYTAASKDDDLLPWRCWQAIISSRLTNTRLSS